MRERVIQFGLKHSLCGILSLSEGTTSDCGVIFLNSGILHSVGASRLHVLLARDLAAKGIPSFRFDQSTIGDAGPRFAGGTYLEAATSETIEAINVFITKTGVQKIILFGLCSGSDVAFETATIDARITGLIQLDPYVYRTLKYYWTYYAPRFFNISSWKNFLTRSLRVKNAPTRSEFNSSWFEKPEYVRSFPPKKLVKTTYTSLAKRGVRFLCVFSGGQVYAYNYEGQLQACLSDCSFGDVLTERFYPNSSHIFTDIQDQLALRSLVGDWVGRIASVTKPSIKTPDSQTIIDEKIPTPKNI